MLHTRHIKFTFIVTLVAACLTAMMATSVFAEQLTVKYAAQNYEGPPRFQVQAYNGDSPSFNGNAERSAYSGEHVPLSPSGV